MRLSKKIVNISSMLNGYKLMHNTYCINYTNPDDSPVSCSLTCVRGWIDCSKEMKYYSDKLKRA